MAFERGLTTQKLEVTGKAKKSGTKIYFKPDTQIFTETRFEYTTITSRLRELAFLNSGITLTARDERVDPVREDTFLFKDGLKQFVEHLRGNRKPLHPKAIVFATTKDEV
jgi:DNA gyrase subunit B